MAHLLKCHFLNMQAQLSRSAGHLITPPPPRFFYPELWPRGYKASFMFNPFSMVFQILIKTKMLKNKDVSCFQTLSSLFIMLMNVKMPDIVGILTFMSMINHVTRVASILCHELC